MKHQTNIVKINKTQYCIQIIAKNKKDKHIINNIHGLYLQKKKLFKQKKKCLWKNSHYKRKYMNYSMHKCHEFNYIFISYELLNIKLCQKFYRYLYIYI